MQKLRGATAKAESQLASAHEEVASAREEVASARATFDAVGKQSSAALNTAQPENMKVFEASWKAVVIMMEFHSKRSETAVAEAAAARAELAEARAELHAARTQIKCMESVMSG